MSTKYIFVTGGVVSSIGKGIVAASLGRLLKNRGLKRFSKSISCESGAVVPDYLISRVLFSMSPPS